MKASSWFGLLALLVPLSLAGCGGGAKEHAQHPQAADKDLADVGSHGREEEEIQAALAELSSEDRRLAEAQRFCPIMADNRLGSMGVPFKVLIEDDERQAHAVFLCCKGCRKKALADTDKTLTKVAKLKAKSKAAAPKS